MAGLGKGPGEDLGTALHPAAVWYLLLDLDEDRCTAESPGADRRQVSYFDEDRDREEIAVVDRRLAPEFAQNCRMVPSKAAVDRSATHRSDIEDLRTAAVGNCCCLAGLHVVQKRVLFSGDMDLQIGAGLRLAANLAEDHIRED